MKSIRRVLVGVRDLESRALPAVRKAAALAEAFDAELVLFHAMAVPVTASIGPEASGNSSADSGRRP